MSESVVVVWDEALLDYDFGPGHPLAPVRLELTMALARELGILARPGVDLLQPVAADDALLTTVHAPEYVNAVRAEAFDPTHGLGTPDDPIFAGMHAAAALIVGTSVAAARAVWESGAQHAVSIAGGLHHAMPTSASGFCIYNDPAIAIRWLLDRGAQRVAYVDIDVHHGDGVQAVFYADPRVLTVSLHESGRYLFPGTGFPEETGAAGTSVNVALPPGTEDSGWLRAFHAVVPPLVRAFAPDVLVSQHGCDSHRLDPLAHLELTVDGQRGAYEALHALAHEVCAGRWLATGGGGYQLARVVPRAWTHLLAIATGQPLEPTVKLPDGWRALAARRVGGVLPETLGDGGTAAYQPWRPGADGEGVDAAIAATVEAIFPHHGLRAGG